MRERLFCCLFFCLTATSLVAEACSSDDGGASRDARDNLGAGRDGGEPDGFAADGRASDAPSRCPEQQPSEAYACNYMGGPGVLPGTWCPYDAVRCTCTPIVQNAQWWHCESVDGEPGCPAEEPVSGRSCYASRLAGKNTCSYGATTCTCEGGPPDEAALWECAQ